MDLAIKTFEVGPKSVNHSVPWLLPSVIAPSIRDYESFPSTAWPETLHKRPADSLLT